MLRGELCVCRLDALEAGTATLLRMGAPCADTHRAGAYAVLRLQVSVCSEFRGGERI